MSRYVSKESSERVQALMFGEVSGKPIEQFLQQELIRYVPQLVNKTDQEIADFVAYQQGVYLYGAIPEMGRPIASLNPTFTDSIKAISFSSPGKEVYTRASVKENGYRMQIHLGYKDKCAFTRQFTQYDLRMFPEIQVTSAKLPVMIGDAELANKRHIHLAGFNRVELRFPDMTIWPKSGQDGLDRKILDKYLSDPELFSDYKSLPDTELTLVFHGLFAIADPATWDEPKDVQMDNLISLCKLPIDYRRIDEILDLLAKHIEKHSLNARVVNRWTVKNSDELKKCVDTNKEQGYEGTCVAQSVWNREGNLVVAPRSVKIKAYESLDCILLGLYLDKSGDGLVEENIKGAMVGLYDESLGVYLAATKVNLDPNGVQIKTTGQKVRLMKLRSELVSLVSGRIDQDEAIYSLYDAFMLQGSNVLKHIFGDEKSKKISLEEVVGSIPLRSDLNSLWEAFVSEKKEFCAGTARLSTVPRKFIAEHLEFFQAIEDLDKNGKRRFFQYFSRVKKIKATSARLVKPQIVVDTREPIIIETLVFDIKWGNSPYPAGFHSWYGDSFCFNNCFAERVRYDKNTSTNYDVVHSLARTNTPK